MQSGFFPSVIGFKWKPGVDIAGGQPINITGRCCCTIMFDQVSKRYLWHQQIGNRRAIAQSLHEQFDKGQPPLIYRLLEIARRKLYWRCFCVRMGRRCRIYGHGVQVLHHFRPGRTQAEMVEIGARCRRIACQCEPQ